MTDRPDPTSKAVKRIPALLACATVGVQISYPLTGGTARDIVTVAVVTLFAAACVSHAAVARGLRWALTFLVITAGIGLGVEILGTATGFPFGCYEYASNRLGPSVAGVPLIVPLAWTAGMYPVWIVTSLLFQRKAVRIFMAAVGIVGWDLYLDAQMVADGQWTWCSGIAGLPGLPDIPLTNYLGWFVVGLVMASCLTVFDRPSARAPANGVPIGLFLWTWLGSALAHAVFLGLPFSAIYGFLGMGVLGVPLLRRLIGSPN